jgi:hypothetical protein
MVSKLVGLAAVGLVLIVSPALAFENESSEITLPPAATTSIEAALVLPEDTVLPQSVAPAASALVLPEPETTPIAPYSGCHRKRAETVYLTN